LKQKTFSQNNGTTENNARIVDKSSNKTIDNTIDNKIIDNKIIDNKIIDNKIIDNKIIDNKIDNSINQTIVVVGYGNEDMSKIDKEKILDCLKQGFHSAVRLTDVVHFDPDKPENHNVYVSNLKNKYAMVFRNGSWQAITKIELINKIYNDKKNYVENNMETFYNKMSVSQKNSFHRWLHTDDEHPKIKEIKEEIRLLLFNRKELVNKNFKQISN